MELSFFLLFWFVASSVLYGIYKHYNHKRTLQLHTQNPLSNCHPANTIFAFDLHEVIVTFNYKQLAYLILFTRSGWLTMFYFGTLWLRPFFLLDFIGLLTRREGCVAEEAIDYLCKNHSGMGELRSFCISIINSFSPDEHTVKVINALKEKNYNVYLFSNIGEGAFEEMFVKHEQLFSQLDGFHVSTAEDNWTRKPHPRAFSLFVEKFNKEGKYIVFVDDCKRNIMAAEKVDRRFLGIHFVAGKRLLEDFLNWDII